MRTLQSNRIFGQRFDRGFVVAFVAAAVLTLSARSRAEPDDPHRRDLLKRAAAALNKGRPIEALQAWRTAYEIRPELGLACDIGRAEVEHGRVLEGAQFLGTCLHLASPEPPDYLKSKLPKLRELYDKARKEVGSLVIVARESGAEVSVDGRRVGKTPLREIFVDPGTRRVVIEREGYKREELTITIRKGEERTIPVKLIKLAPIAKAAPGPLLPVRERKDLRPPDWSPTVLVGGASATAIGIGLGAAFTVVSNGKAADSTEQVPALRADLSNACTREITHPACVAYLDAETERRRFRDLAVVSFVTAGIAAAATVAYIVYPRAPKKPSLGKGGVVLAEW
jgi:hypothetical protein